MVSVLVVETRSDNLSGLLMQVGVIIISRLISPPPRRSKGIVSSPAQRCTSIYVRPIIYAGPIPSVHTHVEAPTDPPLPALPGRNWRSIKLTRFSG